MVNQSECRRTVPKHSVYVDELEAAWQRGDLETTCRLALPFFKEHRNDFISFLRDFKQKHIDLDIEFLAKLFIFRFNMPFDMGQYMRRQSSFIQENLANSNSTEAECHCSATRQQLIGEWIRECAAMHRRREILRQIFCVGKMKDSIIPELQKITE
jgi:hypothetical protein